MYQCERTKCNDQEPTNTLRAKTSHQPQSVRGHCELQNAGDQIENTKSKHNDKVGRELLESRRPCPNGKHAKPLFWTGLSQPLVGNDNFLLWSAHKLGRVHCLKQVSGQPWPTEKPPVS